MYVEILPRTEDQIYKKQKFTDTNGYQYTKITGDENYVRTYALKNGLKVFLAQNFDAPKIQTYIAVRTGSNNDPADNTGLAHYLEHMMFKGGTKIGTINWQQEQIFLNEIAELYEQHKAEHDSEKKKQIYRKIDDISQEASKFAIANEYDKIMSSLGATGTNAHTWLDETIYKNNIPSNELERWLKIEKERFSSLVLRLFHTELESVYEEFNRAQDNDSRLVNCALMELLFPQHPNGQQTTLGKAEHLKNPSMKAIHQYFSDFYVPNNYAMILVGDLDFDKTIQLVDRYFGVFEYKELPEKIKIIEKPLEKITTRTVKSPTIPRVQLAWRTESYGSEESMFANIIANILSNRGEAGLLDLNINQQQKMLYSQAFSVGFKNYGYFSMIAVPKENQTLDDGIAMMLEQIELIKKGNFPDWMIPAIINDFKIQRLKIWETADGLASTIYGTYIKGRSWEQEINEMLQYESIIKDQVVEFAKNFFKDNYVVVYKEKGKNENLIRVENPGITPVKLNRDVQSQFFKEILNEPSVEIQPEFIDYQKEIQTAEIKGKMVSFVKNDYNNIAQVSFIFPFGSDHDKELALSTYVLQYLGTERFSPQKLKEEFFKIGITNQFQIKHDQLIISLSGLENDLPKGIKLLHHWLKNAVADQQVYNDYVQIVLESRVAMKKDKNKIMNALINYAKYGSFSRTTDVISEQHLHQIHCEDLMNKMKSLFDYEYQIFFYGRNFEAFKNNIYSFITPQLKSIPEPRIYPELGTHGKVYFANYDMVQMEMSKVAKGFNVETNYFGKISLFNEYFGSGLSSIVFQEIRESKSLAYSAYVYYKTSTQLGHPDYVSTYIGTQPDKLMTAVDTMANLMRELPQIQLQFESAKKATLKQIASGRIKRTNIFFNYLNLQKLGITYDIRKDVYEEIQNLTLEKLTDFYNSKVKPLTYNTAIIGKRENLDKEAVAKLGELRELQLDEIFGF